MFWAASVWASKAMAAAKLPPVSGSGAETVLVAAEGSSAIGWVVQVNGIFESKSVSLVILLHAVLGNIWAQGLGLGWVRFGSGLGWVQGLNGLGFSEWVTAPTQLLCVLFSYGWCTHCEEQVE